MTDYSVSSFRPSPPGYYWALCVISAGLLILGLLAAIIGPILIGVYAPFVLGPLLFIVCLMAVIFAHYSARTYLARFYSE